MFTILKKELLLFSVVFFLSYTFNLDAQSIVDNLETSIKNHTSQDTARVKLLNKLAFKLYIKDKARAIELVDESEKLSEKIKYIEGKSESLYVRGLVNIFRSQNEKGIFALEESLAIFKKLNDKKGISKCFNAIGISYLSTGEYDDALMYYHKSLLVNIEIGDEYNIATALNNKANIYLYKGDYNSALEYYFEAYEIKRKSNRIREMAIALNNIGNVYIKQSNYPKGLEYLNKSLVLKKEVKDSVGMAKTLLNIGNIYKDQKNYEKAFVHYKKALPIFERKNDINSVIGALNNLSSIYSSRGNTKKAIELLKQSISLAKQIKDKRQVAIGLHNMGDIHTKLGKYNTALDFYNRSLEIDKLLNRVYQLFQAYINIAKVHYLKKEYGLALKTIQKSDKYSLKFKSLKLDRLKTELLSDIHNELGNFEKAFSNHKKYKKLSDSIFNKENIRKIAELEYEYKYKQELELANFRELKLTKKVKKTSSELQQSKLNLLIGVIVFLLISIVLGIRIFLLKIRNIKSVNENILIEQKLLRSQMTPHFIFNSLSVLQGVILNNETTKAVKYLSKFSKLLRITLENSRDKLVLLEKELEAVENYIIVQNLGAEVLFEYEIQKVEEINEKEMLVPPMLIQPFVENAIEHAFEEDQKDRKISIHLKYTGEQLVCLILDNGIGIEAKKEKVNSEKKSLATTITAERLRMLSKEFNVEASITVKDRSHSNQKGTEVVLVLPHKRA